MEACEYSQALQRIWRQILDPANQYMDRTEPWSLVKRDESAARRVLYDLVEQLRAASILLKPFMPLAAETIYRTFNFPQPWDRVRFADVWVHPTQVDDLRIIVPLPEGKVAPLFPRLQ
jgi:methionyl-tRNA synthetase